MIKKFVGSVGSWTLYYLGDWIHWPMIWFDWAWIYPIYNRVMIWSSDIQAWADVAGPWQPYQPDDEGEA